MPNESGAITGLLRRWRSGDDTALEELAPLLYPELRLLARSRLRAHAAPLSPTELVHETYLRLSRGSHPEWFNRSHFYYIVSRLMRQVLVDLAREAHAEKRGGASQTISLNSAGAVGAPLPAAGVLDLHRALEELAHLDPRKARVLELRYFGGLQVEEIADALNVAAITIRRDLRAGTAWLRSNLAPGARE